MLGLLGATGDELVQSELLLVESGQLTVQGLPLGPSTPRLCQVTAPAGERDRHTDRPGSVQFMFRTAPGTNEKNQQTDTHTHRPVLSLPLIHNTPCRRLLKSLEYRRLRR